MLKQIAIPAPTLEALMGSRTAAHDLLRSRGFTEIIDVYPFFIKTMEDTWLQAKQAGSPRVSPACPRARKLCSDDGIPSLVPDILSPAALALKKTVEAFRNEKIDVRFISPCPFKSAELAAVPLPENAKFSSLALKEILESVSLSHNAHTYLEKNIVFPNIDAACVRTRGVAEARSFLSGGLEKMGPRCVDMQLCSGGCLGGEWCPK